MYSSRYRDEALVRRQLALGPLRAEDRGVRGAWRVVRNDGGGVVASSRTVQASRAFGVVG